jgi:hypothetical protein
VLPSAGFIHPAEKVLSDRFTHTPELPLGKAFKMYFLHRMVPPKGGMIADMSGEGKNENVYNWVVSSLAIATRDHYLSRQNIERNNLVRISSVVQGLSGLPLPDAQVQGQTQSAVPSRQTVPSRV